MKKIFTFFTGLLGAFLLASCDPTTNVKPVETPSTLKIEESSIKIDGSEDGGTWFFWSRNLDDAVCNQTVKMHLTCDMVIENSFESGSLMWQVNSDNKYPKVATVDFKKNDSSTIHVDSTESIQIGSSGIFYLSNYNEAENTTFTNSHFKIQVKNLKLEIEYVNKVPADLSDEKLATKVSSLKELLKDSGIEHIGFAVESNELLNDSEKQAILKHHATTTTMGNEFKPDFLFAWQLNSSTGKAEKFTASNGITIDVPATLPGLVNADKYLAKCKDLGIKMRGHVLVWYSQTPAEFFDKNYEATQSGYTKTPKNPVDKATMTARQEWYIKTVLEHVKEWEKENSPDEHVIYTWDVVNEALSDGAAAGAYLRKDNNSNWAAIYGNENYEYIINAFRFANKYAPKDVLLAYNDYNEASGAKHQGYLKIIDEILAHQNDSELPTRINIAGMQSHNQPDFPSLSDYEKAIKNFIEKGLDVQVTELDITGSAKDSSYQTFNPPTSNAQKSTYNAYFKLYLKYAKTAEKAHGVTGVTLWGINDENSWRASGEPLLFKKYNGKYYAKDAYYGVIEAIK
ncbi:MAG: endo-1,4-beta-xylanase [Treponema sp.]|nr:endo-1,4-beta-xylanase [Treponema sp.]